MSDENGNGHLLDDLPAVGELGDPARRTPFASPQGPERGRAPRAHWEWMAGCDFLARHLTAALQELEDVTRQRVTYMLRSASAKLRYADLERRFTLHAQGQGWLDGPNEQARKLAKERAFADHGNDEPWKLADAAGQIQTDESVLRELELRAGYLRESLESYRALIPLYTEMVRANDPANDRAGDDGGPTELPF